ncbi:MAG: hypothetical protein HXY50_00460, partial [Ignavibacteriaceae bacterium]|nr:hypothetical protein [Ignavibacteriaceae bacterium]
MDTKEAKVKLVIDGKEAHVQMVAAQEDLEKVRTESENVRTKLAEWGQVITGFNFALDLGKQAISALGNLALEGLGLDVLRSNFKGTQEDIELFRKATSGIVSEANLIKFSNQATDLGLSLEQQAIFFDLADDAADKYGTTIEQGFAAVVSATEGSTRALKKLGIQKEIYEEIVKKLAAAQGTTIDKLDAETQKQIKLQAIIQASGKSIDDLKNKVADKDDKIQSFGIMVEEAKQKVGLWIGEAIVPAIEQLNKLGSAGVIVTGSTAALTGTIAPLIPVIAQLRIAKALWATQSALTAGSVNGLNLSVKTLFATISAGVAAGVGLGMLIDYIRDKHREAMEDTSAYDKQLTENSEKMKWISEGKRFVPGKGIIQLKETIESIAKNSGKTVAEWGEELVEIDKKIQKVIAGSKEHTALLKQRKEIEEKITPKEDKKKTHEENLANQLKYYDELVKVDKNYFGLYKVYLDDQLKYYTQILLKRKGTFEKFTAEEIASLNNVKQRIEDFKPPKIELGEFEMEDIPFDPDKYQKDQDKLKQLRLESVRDSLKHQEAELELWYAEQKELDLYKEGTEAKTLIDQQYADRKKEIMKDAVEKEKDSIREYTDFAKSALTEISDLDRSGSEKREAILRQWYARAIDLMLNYLLEFITAKSAELAVHTGTEISKTAVTAEQSAVRASMAGSSGGGGGGG